MITANRPIPPPEVARHYDALDDFYREVWGDHVHHGLWLKGNETRDQALRQHVEMIAQEAGIGSGTRVCDIGCGYGATARMIAQTFGADVTAVTVSPAQHAFAERRQAVVDASMDRSEHSGRCHYVLADWLHNTLPDQSFDSAIAVESSEHMPDLAGFFAQAFRVLKPGGRLAVTAWLSCERPTPAQRRFLLEPVCRGGHMPHMGTFSEYQRLAVAAGFEFLRVQDMTRRIERTWPTQAAAFLRRLLAEPRYARFLFGRHARNRAFSLTMLRIWFSYRTGAMRYGVFTLRKP